MRQGIGHDSRGFAIATVTMVGFVIMLSASAFVIHGTGNEARAVEEDIARLRLYWAGMGYASYAFSRGSQGPLCSGDCPQDAQRAASYRGYVDELETAVDSYHRFSYPEIASGFYNDLNLLAQ